jgi:hypothetical protein
MSLELCDQYTDYPIDDGRRILMLVPKSWVVRRKP